MKCLWCISDARQALALNLGATDAARYLEGQHGHEYGARVPISDAVTTVAGDAVCLSHAIRATDIILARPIATATVGPEGARW